MHNLSHKVSLTNGGNGHEKELYEYSDSYKYRRIRTICIYLYLYVWANVCAISPMMIYQNMSHFIYIKTQMFHFVY